jgi:PAS domain S-box-containing protein
MHMTPQQPAPSLDAASPARAEAAAAVAGDDPGLARVLVVDDNADLRDYLSALLRPHYHVETAPDGLAALEAIQLRKPTLILSDVMMPRLDGLGLLRALRSDPELRGIPVLLLSARAGEEATIEGLAALADDYLVKPFSARELLARVRAHVALARQREVFERFFMLSLDMLCIAGVDGYFKRVSPAFAALGYAPEELLRRPMLDFIHPDDVAPTLAELEKLACNVPTLAFENRYRCKDGSYRWLAWNAAPDPSGTLYAVARDVTDNRRAEAELREARDAAEAASRELEAFAYSVAHDLRAPLRSLDGFSLALLEDYHDRLDGEGRQYLTYLRESAQRMAELIDDLLALSRVTRSELHSEEVSLTALAHTTIGRLRQAHPERQVEVEIAAGLTVTGDSRLLAVMMENFLGNAWKFTGKRPRARIEVGATTTGDGRRAYFVRDDGAGFDMAFAHKLFGVFHRLHAAAEFEGTGIGLATAQRVIHRHGGRVWAKAEVDAGATFYFTLHERDAVA